MKFSQTAEFDDKNYTGLFISSSWSIFIFDSFQSMFVRKSYQRNKKFKRK